MEWTPIFLLAVKVLLFVPCMFFAIKWHYDQGRKEKEMAMREVLLGGVKVAAAFVLLVLVLGLFTFVAGRKLGLNF